MGLEIVYLPNLEIDLGCYFVSHRHSGGDILVMVDESGGVDGGVSMGEFLVMVDERKIVRCTMAVVVDKNMDGGRWRE